MTNSDLLNFDYENNKKTIFDQLILEISEAVEKDRHQIYIKNLSIVDEQIDVVAQRQDWPTCLEKALAFYKSIEDYESCARCQKVLEKLTRADAKKSKPKNARKKA